MAEQPAGTAWRGPFAVHAAAVRAVDDMAAQLTRHRPVLGTGLGSAAACACCGDRWPCNEVAPALALVPAASGEEGQQ